MVTLALNYEAMGMIILILFLDFSGNKEWKGQLFAPYWYSNWVNSNGKTFFFSWENHRGEKTTTHNGFVQEFDNWKKGSFWV